MNLADDDDNGTHWVCCFIVPELKLFYYLDPYGVLLNGIIPNSLIKKYDDYKFINNLISYQNLNNDLCGYYSILFAKAINNNKNKFIQLNRDELQKFLYQSIN